MKRGDRVWVSDASEEDARGKNQKSIFLTNVGGKHPFACVAKGDEMEFPDGNYLVSTWRYAVPVPEKKIRPATHYEAMQIARMGNRLVRLARGEWVLPEWHSYVSCIEDYEWTEADPKTGEPIGEIHKFEVEE